MGNYPTTWKLSILTHPFDVWAHPTSPVRFIYTSTLRIREQAPTDHVTAGFLFISHPSSLQQLDPAVEIVFAVLINGSLFQSVSGRRPVVIGVRSTTLGM